jgi:hypothetical protein
MSVPNHETQQSCIDDEPRRWARGRVDDLAVRERAVAGMDSTTQCARSRPPHAPVTVRAEGTCTARSLSKRAAVSRTRHRVARGRRAALDESEQRDTASGARSLRSGDERLAESPLFSDRRGPNAAKATYSDAAGPTRAAAAGKGDERPQVILIAPARYVLLPLAQLVTGYSVKAMERKIERGDWIERQVWRRAPDGRIMFDIEGFERWVESR